MSTERGRLILERMILAAGFAAMGFLIWRFDPRSVWIQISSIGFGFFLILGLQIFDHMLNALGWSFAFCAEDARDIPFRHLLKGRIAGDGVNYLTPSGTIAGELIRPGMLGGLKSSEIKNTSVVIAKFAQAIGQALFILLGIAAAADSGLKFLTWKHGALAAGLAVLIIASIGTALFLLTSHGRRGEFLWKSGGALGAIRGQMRSYLRRHPERFGLSSLFFCAGYAGGALEAFVICYLMGMPVSIPQAVVIEALSNIIDSILFMVPAKAGTQEAGKMAIFHALGYTARQGLAFGLIRHCREIIWACAGFLLYSLENSRFKGTRMGIKLPGIYPASLS